MLKRRTSHRRSQRVPQRVRVLIADDHTLFLEAVHRLLERHRFDVVALAADGSNAVRLAEATRPDVAVLDVVMPGLGGLDVARALLTVAPGTRVVLVTGSEDLNFVLEGMTLRVRGFVVKSATAVELFAAIRAAARGATYFSSAYEPVIWASLPRSRTVGRARLTLRERQVLNLRAVGKTRKEIGMTLAISARTVETHLRRVMKKLDIHNLAELVRYALRDAVGHGGSARSGDRRTVGGPVSD